MAKVTVDGLAGEVKKILDEYGNEIEENISEVTQRISNKGRTALRNESLSMFRPAGLKKGRYGTGWSVSLDRGRLSTTATIHNAKYPGLPHLLENGHVLSGKLRGREVHGFASGRPHIAPVEEKLVEEFKQQVEAKLR